MYECMNGIKCFFLNLTKTVKTVVVSATNLLLMFVASPLGLWYTFWFIVGGVYLCCNWDKAMVFLPFNGHALIFITWLVMIMRPFVKDINIPWFKFTEFEQKQRKQDNAKKEFESALDNDVKVNTEGAQ